MLGPAMCSHSQQGSLIVAVILVLELLGCSVTGLGLVAPDVFQVGSEDCHENRHLGPPGSSQLMSIQCLHTYEGVCEPALCPRGF